MATISSLGSGSNLDLQSLLDKLVSAEKTPQQNAIDSQKSLTNATISALGTLKSKLSAFQDAQTKLKDATLYAGKTATSSDTSLFTVASTSSADAGSYNIGVINLANANKIASGNFASSTTTVGNGTLTIGVGGSTFDVAITAGVNDTLAGIRDAINNAVNNTGVKASILNVSDGLGGTVAKLVLTASKTGASSQISVSAADSDGNNTDNAGLSQLYYLKGDAASHLSEVSAAQDAKISVDGFTATSSTNTFSDVINGVTITALKGATDPLNPPSGTLTVASDKASVQSAIQSFITTYNDLAKAFSGLTTPSRNADGTLASGSGALSADSSLLTIRAQIKRAIADPISGAPTDLNTLALLGITTNADGTLSANNTKLSNALDTRFDDVKTLFSGTNGIAGKLSSLLSNVVASGGILQTRTDTLNARLRSLDAQQTALDNRIDEFTKRYQKQFTALDSIVSQLNSTGNFLTQQLSASAAIINRKSSSS